jgi:hypothetical protein
MNIMQSALVVKRSAFFLVTAFGLGLTTGCTTSQVSGVWTQPGEHMVDAAPCGSHCRNHQGYEVAWDVSYPPNLRLTNFRCYCRNIGTGDPCYYDNDINIADDAVHHKARIYWRIQSSAVAVRLVADEIQ